MANSDDRPALKITPEDLDKVVVNTSGQSAAPAGAAVASGVRHYGNISSAVAEAPAVEEGKSNVLLQGWFYLGAAGLAGALLGWGIAEPFFVDGPGSHPAGVLLIPSVVAFMCVGFGVAESVVERSPRKAALRGSLSLLLGAVGGLIFAGVAGIVFIFAQQIIGELGVQTYRNPAFWVARGLAWMVFGVAGGVIYGAMDRSGKKVRYGILGGIIGAGLGGMIFDPISMATKAGAPSRGIGFALFGLATGLAMGIVESALKDRWLYVAGGPLAGKQFILYKPVTAIGSSQQSDIYLFKDPSIQPQHASIELRGAQTFLHALGQVYVSGQPTRNRALQNGDLIQIGRYAFHFRERQRK
jgi:hypothetical protein